MFDRVIVSCDDSHFKEFWPIVSKAWNNYFPDKKVTLAFVTDREDDDPLVQKMKNYGDVYLFPLVDGIPTANLAKMSRHILACNFNDEVCMIEDIDTIPLQVDFINRILSQREPNKILFVGNGAKKWEHICKNENALFNDNPNNLLAMNRLSFKKYGNKDFSNLAYSEPSYLKEFFDSSKQP